MSSREILNDLLRDIADRQGKYVGELDENGRLSFVYRESINVVLACLQPDHTQAYLSADFGPVRLLRRDGLFRSLLVANFLGHETGGACFGINETTKTLIFWFRFETSGLRAEELQSILNNFLHLVDRWDERLSSDPPEETSAPEPAEEFLGIRV